MVRMRATAREKEEGYRDIEIEVVEVVVTKQGRIGCYLRSAMRNSPSSPGTARYPPKYL